MEKYGTYKLYKCIENDIMYIIPHDNEKKDAIFAKMAEENLTLIEIKENVKSDDKVRILQPWKP